MTAAACSRRSQRVQVCCQTTESSPMVDSPCTPASLTGPGLIKPLASEPAVLSRNSHHMPVVQATDSFGDSDTLHTLCKHTGNWLFEEPHADAVIRSTRYRTILDAEHAGPDRTEVWMCMLAVALLVPVLHKASAIFNRPVGERCCVSSRL